MEDLAEKLVCVNCTEDEFLQDRIREEGIEGTCDYCQSTDDCVQLGVLAEWIGEVFERYFDCHENDVDNADKPEVVIERIASIGFEIALDLINQMDDGPESFVQSGLYYSEREFKSYFAQGSWDAVCRMIKYQERFFDADGIQVLDELFHKLLSMKAGNGKSPFRKLKPDKRLKIYRGRIANDEATLQEIILNPAVAMGPPSAKLAQAGRLNPIGIPVFYGAFSRRTCIAELHPFVGGDVVTGEFNLNSDIDILDLTILEDLILDTGFFDPDYVFKMDYGAFVRGLHAEIIKPLSPNDEQLEYLPTQYLAAFLSRQFKPAIQGIVFGSSQRGMKNKNIVIFPKSDPPGLSIHVPVPVALSSYVLIDDEVYERHHPRLDKEGYQQYLRLQEETKTYNQGCKLSFVPGSLRVHKIKRVEYSSADYDAEPIEGTPPDWNDFFGYDVKTGLPLGEDLSESDNEDVSLEEK